MTITNYVINNTIILLTFVVSQDNLMYIELSLTILNIPNYTILDILLKNYFLVYY